METLSLILGAEAVKLIARLWTQGTPLEGTGDELVDILRGAIASDRERRAVTRQFEELADNLADRLAPFLDVEFRGIDSGEAEAAAIAAGETLRRAGAADWKVLFGANLDAAQLAGTIRMSDSNAVSRAGLGEAGSALYDTLIAECASYISSVAYKLPGFATAQARELLGRTSQLAAVAAAILDNLPTSAVPDQWGVGSEDQRFENKYRHAVSEKTDKLELFGVSAPDARIPYPLSVAYISLSVDHSQSTAAFRSRTESKQEKSSGQGVSAEVSRVEDLLESTDRLLLTGGAGSGKTTLVQWLALSAVTEVDHLSHVDSWKACIPFVVPLRRFVGKELPSPETFVTLVAPNLAGAMPDGWVHRVLASRRGMLLVDGLDEIPEADREAAREWVVALMNDFEGNKVVVTSRTTAITGRWATDAPFQRAELLPMEPSDIRAFVSHWHAAARSVSDEARASALEAAEASMVTIVRERPAIRSLCTSPLLCALVCALHLQSGSSLPNSRMDIYKTALEMLILRRDNDRSVNTLVDPELGYGERETLLRVFALWMHENGASDGTYADYEARIGQGLRRLYRVTTPATDVARFLLERSGVLREPIHGRVDFVHRTFLEYLAAAEVIYDDSIEMLVRLAHDDHWREVVVMAAGHANGPQKTRLVDGLLDRGASDAEHKHRLFLLAVACMETSPDLLPATRAKLNDALAEVLPPRNMTEAAAVASAGSLAIAELAARTGRPATSAAACVRALSLIGGDEAMTALATYGRDRRVTVTRQLIRAWPSFDTERYATEVLAQSTLDNGRIVISELDQIPHAAMLANLRSVYLDFPRRVLVPEELPELPVEVYGADLSGIGISSLWELSLGPRLTSLTLRNTPLHSLDGLGRFPQLRYLSVAGSRRLADVRALNDLVGLEYLDLSGTAISELRLASLGASIGEVRVDSATELRAVVGPQNVTSLSLGYTPNLLDVSGIAESANLRRLTLTLPPESDNQLRLPPHLESLTVRSNGSPLTVNGSVELNHLSLYCSITPDSFEWVQSLRSLRMMRTSIETLSDEFAVVVDALLALPKLQYLSLSVRDPVLEGQLSAPSGWLLDSPFRNSLRFRRDKSAIR